ncbi:hypothetical protein PIB30_025202 [Stylosanthes scabra]|uniref:RRM domain-containing protein n=1 Tax=Stylosanthes scabra TaxID=79078 RepID=A0ABU6QAL8_9FABA|nr:hypothetical protein [Stylosanthes scabra]
MASRQGEKEIGDGERRWLEKNTFSIFADNLLPDTTYQWLWKVFNNTGKVEDIYLSRKIRVGNPLKFAFIRYRTREEMERMIEHLDGWIVWDCRLRITESRYRRMDKTTKGVAEGRYHPEIVRPEAEPARTNPQNKSYRDVVVGIEA